MKRCTLIAAIALYLGACFGEQTNDTFATLASLNEWPVDHQATELVVDFHDDVNEDVIAQIERELDIDLRYNSEHAHDEVLTIATLPKDRMREIAYELIARGVVEAVEPNYTYEASKAAHGSPHGSQSIMQVVAQFVRPNSLHEVDEYQPNDPDYPKQWHMRKIGMAEAWTKSRGKGAVVAVLDTGVAYEDYKNFKRAPDLANTKFVEGYNFVGDTKHANDDHSHGTHVAGTIAQSTNNGVGVTGIAFEAAIMPVKVLSGRGSGSASDIADAIRFAADHGANVINMSLGGGPRSQVMESAVTYARKKGVLVACAAGNGGRRNVEYPAAYDGAFAVSSTGPADVLAYYSSYGPEVDIAAPGGDKRSGEQDGVLQQTISRGDPSQFEYAWYQGTSMATPHVAGVGALVFAAGVKNVAEVEKILQESADKIDGETGKSDKYGAGRLNAAKAVELALKRGGGGGGGGGCNAGNPWVWLVAVIVLVFLLPRLSQFSRNAKFLAGAAMRGVRR